MDEQNLAIQLASIILEAEKARMSPANIHKIISDVTWLYAKRHELIALNENIF